jgi:membrane-associated phospholipid phosphatase
MIMKNLAAHIISIILIPLLAPTYLFWIILVYFPQLSNISAFNDKVLAIISIFGLTALLPFVLVGILYKRKILKTWTLDNQKDRIIPQIFSCFNYVLICLFLVYKVGLYNALTLSMVAVTISVIVLTLITPYWKISTHACGAWGMFAILYVLNYKFHVPNFLTLYYIIFFSTVAVCAARLYLRVHTPLQVLAGSLLGTLIGFSLFYYLLP